MGQLASYARLLLDSYLVTSDTNSIELSMSRDETDTPTHESPTKFLLDEATGELTIAGYISRSPNAFVLEKRLSAVFNDPDGTHYMGLIPDYRLGSGWDPAYIGRIVSSKMEIKAVSKSVVTINGTMRVESLARPDLGDHFDDLRAACIYYSDPTTLVATTAVYGDFVLAPSSPGKMTVTVFTWGKSGAGTLTWNIEQDTDREGTGDELLVAWESIGTSDGVSIVTISGVSDDWFRFGVKSTANETVGLAVFIQYV